MDVVVNNIITTTPNTHAPALRAEPAAGADPNAGDAIALLARLGYSGKQAAGIVAETGCTVARIERALVAAKEQIASIRASGEKLGSPLAILRAAIRDERKPLAELQRLEWLSDIASVDQAVDHVRAAAASAKHARQRKVLDSISRELFDELRSQAIDDCQHESLKGAWRTISRPLHAPELCDAMCEVLRVRVESWTRGMSAEEQGEVRAAYIAKFSGERHRAWLNEQLKLPLAVNAHTVAMFDAALRSNVPTP